MQMINLIMDPNGEKVLDNSTQEVSTVKSKMGPPRELGASVEQLQENVALKQKVTELEEKITKVGKQLQKCINSFAVSTAL